MGDGAHTGAMAEEEGVRDLGSSVDVGWHDGKPRFVGEDAKNFFLGKGATRRVADSQIAGRMPRPRSKNPPKPALTVNYGAVPRNDMDNINLEDVSSSPVLFFTFAFGMCSCQRVRLHFSDLLLSVFMRPGPRRRWRTSCCKTRNR